MSWLITVIAAVICTLARHKNNMKIGILCIIYWLVSIIWFLKAVLDYTASKESFFIFNLGNIINDIYVGLAAVGAGLVIWLVILFIINSGERKKKK